MALDRTASDGPVLRALAGLVAAGAESVTVVHVVLTSTTERADREDGAPSNEAEQLLLSSLRSTIEGALGDTKVRPALRILHGDPAQRISEYAQHVSCDLIVLGTHHRGPLGRLLRGSVSAEVVATGHQSVLVVKEPRRPGAPEPT